MQQNIKNVNNLKKEILIVGGGFAGVQCALDLARKGAECSITIVSKEDDLIYYPAMYRYVTGSPQDQVAIPLAQIFKKYPEVAIINDEITHIDAQQKMVTGASGAVYNGDYLVLAIGSENNYFHIEGVDQISYNFKSFEAAEILRARIHKLFEGHVHSEIEEMLVSLHFVIVGGGPSGVELAGELAVYAAELARFHSLPESIVTIDIVERNERLLARMPEKISRKVAQRLQGLGVHLLLNRTMIKNESWTVFLRDMKLGAKTVIWTAGVRSPDVSQDIDGLTYTKRGSIVVDEHLETQLKNGVFALGDIADGPHSGLAQGAISHGNHVASVIAADLKSKKRPQQKIKEPWHVVPVGPGWGALHFRKITLFGWLAWASRFLADARYYMSILPISEVIAVLKQQRTRVHETTNHKS